MRPKNLESILAAADVPGTTMLQADCIVCGEPAAYAYDSRKLPDCPVCSECKRAIQWARKHMEADR